jgi:thiol-disulfide isomerase/thioredoxin
MIFRACIVCFFLTIVSTGVCQHRPDLKSVSVKDATGKERQINLPVEKPFVLLLLGTDCPITQKYVPTLLSLKREFAGKIEIIGIFPNQTTVEEMNAFVADYKLSLACYIDQRTEVVRALNATVTPEAFLFDQHRKQVYSGAIDNWFYKLGSYRTRPSKHYLRNAIRSSLNGTVTETARIEPIGCLISRPRNGHEHH